MNLGNIRGLDSFSGESPGKPPGWQLYKMMFCGSCCFLVSTTLTRHFI